MSLTKKYLIISLALLFSFCASHQNKINSSGIPIEINYPSCDCNNSLQVYQLRAEKDLFEEGVLRYSQRHSIVIDPTFREGLIAMESPRAYLRGVIIQEVDTIHGQSVKALATFDDTRLERTLKNKPLADEIGIKVFRRRDSGLRGLEAIKGFQKQNRNYDSNEDTDKFVGDRIDNIGRIRNNKGSLD